MASLMYVLNDMEMSVKRKFKKVFEKLNDDYVIRTPVLDECKAAQIVIEGPDQSWLLVGVHKELPTESEVDKFLTLNNVLTESDFPELHYLAICEVGESLFSQKDASLEKVSIIEQPDFFARGEQTIEDLMVKVQDAPHALLKKHLVSESVINAACTTRRATITRDTGAKLQAFFLDYDQELATKYDILEENTFSDLEEGFSVRLINGVAGCGKTLILINRALLYCKKYPDRQTLLLIHNKPVTADVEYKFEQYLDGKPDNLTIKTFHAYAYAQQRKVSRYLKPLFTDKQKKPFIEQILNQQHNAYQALTLSDSQIWSELEYINEYLIESKARYLEYERQGRGFSLSQSQREYIWQLYELVVAMMSSPNNGYLPSLYIRNLCLSKDEHVRIDQYDHILIDETQFFFPSWLELVKKSIKHNGQLFLCADPNQGFLKSRLSWKSVGMNVRGRTKKLSYSYRTTYEIMTAANALLAHLDEDSEDFIQPDLEKMTRGQKPQVIYSGNPQTEQKRFLNELRDCISNNAIPLQQIIVLCSETINPWHLKPAIEHTIGKATVVNCNDAKDLATNLGDKIRLMNINSCTGMEAGIIFVLGVGDLLNKANNLDLSDEEKGVVQQESTRKLYVAMTRAGQKLILFSTEKLPENVEALVDISA